MSYIEKNQCCPNEFWIFKGIENHVSFHDPSLKLLCSSLQIFDLFFCPVNSICLMDFLSITEVQNVAIETGLCCL